MFSYIKYDIFNEWLSEMKKIILSAVFLFFSSESICSEFFAVKADDGPLGIEMVTSLSSKHHDCPKGYQFAKVELVKKGKGAKTNHSVGCWISMPGGKVQLEWVNILTGESSQEELLQSDFFTTKPADFWWKFTPGYDGLGARKQVASQQGLPNKAGFSEPEKGSVAVIYGIDSRDNSKLTISITKNKPDTWCEWGLLATYEWSDNPGKTRACWRPYKDGDVYIADVGHKKQGDVFSGDLIIKTRAYSEVVDGLISLSQ
ncbi:hypothetical protein [Alcanivorax hongdengensis]|uniref:hypothetical protein n=1 Tax=Alcanivorax hongdengensis TaxID=519051 RepID=UPI0012F8A018|nr:hypothetical protein [Alcanivorax hongdengensis]